MADFETAAALEGAERERFLAERRAEDPAAAAELEKLLAADRASGVLDTDARRLIDELGLPTPTTVEIEPTRELTPPTGAAPPPLAPAATPGAIGRYEVRERIGRGGFGDVYRGFDPVLKRAVAIKTCLADDTTDRARFVREAELAARLVHPNIVTIHDFGVDGETPYLVQELLPGEDLSHRLARGGEIPLAVKVRLLLETATGLAHAHAAGVVHRDVKPGNLRVLPDGRLKILDFGIARELGAASMLTGDNRVVGTIAYMAPEQARGELADARADVHAWGAVAYELLSGRRAISGDTPAGMLFRLLDAAPPPLREVAPATPRDLAALVDRCLEREPAKRPRDGGELLALLEPIARAIVPSGELAAGAWGGRPRGAQRRWIPWAAALVVTIALVLAARMAIDALDSGDEVVTNGSSRVARANPTVTPGTSAAASIAPPPARPTPAANGLPLTAGAPLPAATSPSAPTPTPAAVAVATGVLQIDARPWGQLTRLVGAAGRELALPADTVTPLALSVPEGDYTAWLTHPQADGEKSCQAHVPADGRALCRVELRAIRASDLLGGGP